MKTSHARVYDMLLVLVLLVAACFRLVGLNWDQDQHLHPDERFLTMVETSISPVKSMADYFNTDTSTLNPHNVGHSFYVYGDLPVIMVRYLADWLTLAGVGAARFVEILGADSPGGRFFAFFAQTQTWSGYNEVALLGRFSSALADLGTIFLLYLITTRIYGRKVALLAAAFSSVTVLQIQQSHFFTTDTFVTFFMFLATYFAVEIAFRKTRPESGPAAEHEEMQEPDSAAVTSVPAVADAGSENNDENNEKPVSQDFVRSIFSHPLFWDVVNVVCFGIALGMAAASKINAAPLAILLPIALITRYFRQQGEEDPHADTEVAGPALHESDEQPEITNKPLKPARLSIEFALVLLVIGAFFSVVSFRIFQPYAFSGPGFFDITPNQRWVQNIVEQQGQTGGDSDSPPALQWARRSRLFSLENIVAWGLGWPLGILACLGFLYMGWRTVMKGEWKQHLLLWSWTALYFTWQSFQGNPTMRYQLPIYPLLALMAAWLALRAFERKPQPVDEAQAPDGETPAPFDKLRASPVQAPKNLWLSITRALPLAMPVLGLVVLLATAAWAYAFVHIYQVDHSRIQATRWIYQNVPGPINLRITQPDGTVYNQPMPYQTNGIGPGRPYDVQFTAFATGTLESIVLGHAVNPFNDGLQQTLTISFATQFGAPAEKTLARAVLVADFAPLTNLRGETYTLEFDQPVALEKDKNYFLRFETTGELALAGSAPITETSWDDGLPLRTDRYDGYGGIYDGNHNLEMYWDDNTDKLNRFTSNLDTSDYIFISSNRQWATTTRLPERYPLTIAFYRNLIGCPPEKDVIWCYNVAKPDTFKGNLGYDLVHVSESFPTLGPWQINDQFAEEAFTVYDHPKALIFHKRADYDAAKVRAILEAVDLTKVIHLVPYKASSHREMDLMLPPDRLQAQREGGTWSELFSYETLQNKYPLLGLLLWYGFISLLGLFTYLFLRLILPGLSDRGYPLARLSGLLLLAYFSWLVASLGGTYSRLTIGIGAALIVIGGILAGWMKREELIQEIRSKWKYFLSVEGILLVFFLIDLFIRIGNPDLWHEGKGGERPMDFAYLNAVLKSTTFPPYDPWFSGGYINYYYWGFVIVSTPIKLLGIVPSLAFNFVLPTLFSLLAMGGFSVAWNLVDGVRLRLAAPPEKPEPVSAEGDGSPAQVSADEEPVPPPPDRFFNLQWLAGIAAGIGLVLVGNLATVRMIYHGLQRLAAPNDLFRSPDISIFQRLAWVVEGFGKLMNGAQMPFYQGDWYWIPSRVILDGPGNEITEFPLFTFLYSDLHAHMIALPLTVLAIGWILSVLLARRMNIWTWLGSLAFGAVVIGALRPTNTWDFPTYLILATLVTGYSIFRNVDVGDAPRFGITPGIQRVFLALAGMGLLVGLSLLFYQPFANWNLQVYNSLRQWQESKTPLDSYLIHWGLFLFVIITWMIWETRQWLAQTPFSALAKLKPYSGLIWLAIGLMLLVIVALMFGLQAMIAWFVMPLAFWALILILRPGLPDVKRFVLFMIGTALAITIFVEIIVLEGDIGRQNTIFKFYIQAWILFTVSSAAAIGWMVSEMHQWSNGWRNFWYTAGAMLLSCALLFTFTATFEKIKDRMNTLSPNMPSTLDSMTYMNYVHYNDNGREMDLSYDYRAIRWMQDNIQGSPVVLEGAPAGIQYTWFSRFSIYTGLPTVVGWQWHQEQQRGAAQMYGTVAARGQEVQQFYRTSDLEQVKSLLAKYGIRYIVVGQLERNFFAEGMAKFDEQNGKLWKEVYRDPDTLIGDTVIYEVLP